MTKTHPVLNKQCSASAAWQACHVTWSLAQASGPHNCTSLVADKLGWCSIHVEPKVEQLSRMSGFIQIFSLCGKTFRRCSYLRLWRVAGDSLTHNDNQRLCLSVCLLSWSVLGLLRHNWLCLKNNKYTLLAISTNNVFQRNTSNTCSC